MNRRTLIISSLIGATVLVALALTACYPRRIDPPLFVYDNPVITASSAALHAADIKGQVLHVVNTHSMEPLLRSDDLVVIRLETYPSNPAAYKGRVITYQADWLPADAAPATHRVVAVDSYGMLLSGDNNANSESAYRVTASNYIGAVVAIYRTVIP